MSAHRESPESLEDVVYAKAKELLSERRSQQPDAEVWVTGTDIAHLTDIDKSDVESALRTMGGDRLHIRDSHSGDIEVLGVDHGRGADSTEKQIDR